MTAIFVSYAEEDTACAERIRQDLEAKGYTTWRKPTSLTIESILYPKTIENVILGSAAVVLVWSDSASQSEWVERQILFAQQLKKLIVPVLLDGTALLPTLVEVSPIASQGSCTNIIPQLAFQLPTVNSTDALITLSEQAGHDFSRERKAAIERAAQMLQRDEHREGVLAILEYLAHHDLMMGVREQAQEVFDTSNGVATQPALPPDESRHFFGVRCEKGHISYFDKRLVCNATHPEKAWRKVQRAGKELDELHLPCQTPGCGAEVIARVDCEGYK